MVPFLYNMEKKTPVSILQELAISQNLVPMYELIHNGTGTQDPVFVYLVKLKGFSEEGAGKSKKQAKHKAAEKMLKNFIPEREEICYCDAEETFESEFDIKNNFVGLLKTYCTAKCYPEPRYDLEEEAGPPHSKTFKIVCYVSKFSEFGISKTKKQAKQEAAYKMLNYLKEFIDDKPEIDIQIPLSSEIPDEDASLKGDEETNNKFGVNNSLISLPESTVYYKDYQKAYFWLQEASPTLKKVLQMSEINENESFQLIQEIAQELEIKFSCEEIPKKYSTKTKFIMVMAVEPALSVISNSKQKCALEMLNSLILLCQE